jgi:tRNA(adenine34) deaminase
MPHLPESAAGSQDLAFMQMALRLAAEAAAAGEVPVGAVVVKDGVVIGSGRNSPIHASDPSAHAEMLALRAAALSVGNYRLDDCTLYVTLEPCAMCSGGILHSRLRRVVFGAPDPKTGCAGSVLNLFAQPQLNHQTCMEGGLLGEEAAQLLQDFFQQKREQKRALAAPLREDALRTPDRCFKDLPGYPWAEQFLSDLPGLAGLRLHFVDEGPRAGAPVYLCLHPIPGWSYSCYHAFADWLGQGARVLAPDLIGFGKSDKPKREDAHTLEFHCQYLLEWLERLGLSRVTLVATQADHPLAHRLILQAPDRMHDVLVLPEIATPAHDTERIALNAPYPDAGHRAGERAFASRRLQSMNKKI